MRTAAIMTAFVAFTAVTGAQAEDKGRMDELGACLAFSYIANGLDGRKDVPEELLPGILALKDEFMFEASINGLDDNAAHTLVVEHLAEQNRVRELKGMASVRERYLPLCSRVAEGLASGRK
jgi:hypothetical protein